MSDSTENCAPGKIHPGETVEETRKVKRQSWSGKLEFLMSCVSLSIGLGNIWRFPFTAYENGGGAFLVPYIVVLFLIGKPMYYMEALLGQFSSKSSVNIWSVCPLFLGVGVGQAYAVVAILTYYSALIAIAFVYIKSSFQAVLPWTYCRDSWRDFCADSTLKANLSSHQESQLYSSSELYFTKVVLNESEDISAGIGLPSWPLSLALLASWCLTFLVVIKGVKSLGKASYFLAIFPYVMLFALLIRALTLEGALDGIIFLLRPNWGELLNIKVWKEAVVQCFFSLTVSLGPIITFSSYNQFGHNVHRDAMIVTTLDAFTSLLAGITIFGILGNLAHNMGTSNIGEIVRSGAGLAFISYPDAIAKFTAVPQLFAVLFFLMLSVLGLGSAVAMQTTVVTIVCDKFQISNVHFWKVSLLVSICGFACGMIYITPGGQWILNLVDFYAGTFAVFFLASCEVIGIAWIYGLQNFCDDVEFMTKRRVTFYWRLCWGFFTPVLMSAILLYSLVDMSPLTYGGKAYPFPANVAGWIVLSIGFLQLPLWALWYIVVNYKSSVLETLKASIQPSSIWGPTDSQLRNQWQVYKANLRDKRKTHDTKLSVFWQKLKFVFDCEA